MSWLRNATKHNGIFFKESIKSQVENWRITHAKCRHDSKSARDIARHQRFLKSSPNSIPLSPFMFGPPINSTLWQKRNFTINGQTAKYIGLKFPIKLKPAHIVIAPHSVASLQLTDQQRIKFKRSLVQYLAGQTPPLDVQRITDQRHPAYNPNAPTYRCIVTKNTKAFEAIGPPYGGILAPIAETEALEIDTITKDQDAPLRYTYAFDAPTRQIICFRTLKKHVRRDQDATSDEELTESDDEDLLEPSKSLADLPQIIKGVIPNQTPLAPDDLGFNIDAVDVRNELSMINDPCNFNKVLGYLPNYVHAANLDAVDLDILGIQHVVFMSCRDLYAGEELFVEYGHQYWTRVEWFMGLRKSFKECRAEASLHAKAAEQAKARFNNAQNQLAAAKSSLQEIERLKDTSNQKARAKAQQLKRLKEDAAAYEKDLADAAEMLVKAETELKKTEAHRSQLLKYVQKKSVEELKSTMGGTSASRLDHYCIYSLVAEHLGIAGRHILSDNPEQHYRSRCQFSKSLSHFVTRCPKCGLRYAKGAMAEIDHQQVCDTYLKVREADGNVEDASTVYDLDVGDGQDLLSSEVRHAQTSAVPKSLIVYELAERDIEISTFLAGFILSVLHGIGAATEDELGYVRTQLAGTLKIDESEIAKELLKVSACCQLLTDPVLNLFFKSNSLASYNSKGKLTHLKWVFDFAKEFLQLQGQIKAVTHTDTQSLQDALLELIAEVRERITNYLNQLDDLPLPAQSPVMDRPIVEMKFPALTERVRRVFSDLSFPSRIHRRVAKRPSSSGERSPVKLKKVEEECQSHYVESAIKEECMQVPFTINLPTQQPVLEISVVDQRPQDAESDEEFDDDDGEPRYVLKATSPLGLAYSLIPYRADTRKVPPYQTKSESNIRIPSRSIWMPNGCVDISPPLHLTRMADWTMEICLHSEPVPKIFPQSRLQAKSLPSRPSSVYTKIFDERPILVDDQDLPILSLIHVYDLSNLTYQRSCYLTNLTRPNGETFLPGTILAPSFNLSHEKTLLRLIISHTNGLVKLGDAVAQSEYCVFNGDALKMPEGGLHFQRIGRNMRPAALHRNPQVPVKCSAHKAFIASTGLADLLVLKLAFFQ